jgi:hypothetical protein
VTGSSWRYGQVNLCLNVCAQWQNRLGKKKLNKRSFTFCRLSLLCGLMLGTSLLWTVAATGSVNAVSAPAGTAGQSEPDTAFDVLEFRIAPKMAASPRKPSALTLEEIADYRKDLADNGPSASRHRDGRFIWMEVNSSVKLSEDLIAGQRQGTDYLLVHNQPPLAVWPEDSGFWYIDERATGARGRPYVGFQYDGAGPDPFYYLTSTNTVKPWRPSLRARWSLQ